MLILEPDHTSSIWITADHHFFHNIIIKYCNRPFSGINEMNKIMIQRWNEKIKPNDEVIHLGDMFCGYKPSGYSWVSNQLNGKKHLIRGNHDRKSDGVWRDRYGFETVQDFLILGDYFFCHYPLLFHPAQTPKQREMIILLKEAFELSKCKYIFHGHSHNTPIKDYPANYYNVGVDMNNFYPINLKEKIIELNWK
jgi:calcineurin-like phosphoesterase family protein